MADGRYFIQPGNDWGSGLAGLGQTLSQVPNIQAAQQQRQALIKQRQKAQVLDTIYQGLANPDQIPELAQQMGVPQIAQAYAQDKEGTIARLKKAAAGMDPVRFKNYQTSLGELTPGGMGQKQKTGSFLVRDPKTGKTRIATGVFDPITGTLKTETSEIPGGQVVSKLGETAAEESARKIEQKAGETRVTSEEKRASDLIDRGISAAESTATIRRSIDLLDQVKTGGFQNFALKAKKIFGVEGANEGELSNSLGKAVLKQLKSTFGTAFTENEGKRLERIESSFGKSTETNKRLLTQALRIAERTAQRARRAAEKRGDMDTVKDIDDLLTFSLSEPETTPAVGKKPPVPGELAPAQPETVEPDFNTLMKTAFPKSTGGL